MINNWNNLPVETIESSTIEHFLVTLHDLLLYSTSVYIYIHIDFSHLLHGGPLDITVILSVQ